jgi:hypothetical protein
MATTTLSEPVEIRTRKANSFWADGDRAFAAKQYEKAYRLYTQGHDLITDCPKMHLEAHRRLKRVTVLHADKREFLSDWLLIKLAPLGVFELVAKFMHAGAADSAACKRGAA